MHRVRIVGVKTLESGKFNGDTGEMENPCKGTIKWEKAIPLTEAGRYNNTEAVILTQEEYDALTSGKKLILDMRFLDFFKTIRTVADDAITEAEANN